MHNFAGRVSKKVEKQGGKVILNPEDNTVHNGQRHQAHPPATFSKTLRGGLPSQRQAVQPEAGCQARGGLPSQRWTASAFLLGIWTGPG